MKNVKGNSAAVFRVKERVLGSRKSSADPSAIKDPSTGKLFFHPSGIKKVSVQYCKELLTNRAPKEEFEEDLKWKQLVHSVRMKEENDDVEFSEEMFHDSLELLKKKGNKKYK